MNDDQTSTTDEPQANNVDDYEEQHVSLVFIFLHFAADINLSVNFISQIDN
jgi:hypothetical protein